LRTTRSQLSIGELFAAVGFRKPPYGGINQSMAVYRGELQLAFPEDCYGG
jgi:hypothetical protein